MCFVVVLFLPCQDGAPSTTAGQLRIDGAAAWSDIAALPGFDAASGVLTVGGFLAGDHAIELRGVDTVAGPDKTPWTVQWYVDTSAPVVSFSYAPPVNSAIPALSAQFVIVVDSPSVTTLEYRWYGQNSSGAWQAMTPSWVPVSPGLVELTSLTPGVMYRLDAIATNNLGISSAVTSWTWSSGACLPAANATITGLTAASIGYGQRVLTWLSVDGDADVHAVDGYEISVDGLPWIASTTR